MVICTAGAGAVAFGGGFDFADDDGVRWMATESSSGYTYYRDMGYYYDYVYENYYSKDLGFSVRCVSDN